MTEGALVALLLLNPCVKIFGMHDLTPYLLDFFLPPQAGI